MAGSEQEFITEHYWGYCQRRDGCTMEYRVARPCWRVSPARQARLDCDAAVLYGPRFAAALDRPRQIVEGWLASPGHCTNLMNPRFSELGAAYAVDPQSDAGIYWVGMFGGQ